jgi:hypothetical protein
MGAKFNKRRRAQVLYAAERAINTVADLNWRVVWRELGEVLASPDARAYSAINSKRVDLPIVSSSGDPIAAIEYRGRTTKELLPREMLLRERPCERLGSGTSRSRPREAPRIWSERFRGWRKWKG